MTLPDLYRSLNPTNNCNIQFDLLTLSNWFIIEESLFYVARYYEGQHKNLGAIKADIHNKENSIRAAPVYNTAEVLIGQIPFFGTAYGISAIIAAFRSLKALAVKKTLNKEFTSDQTLLGAHIGSLAQYTNNLIPILRDFVDHVAKVTENHKKSDSESSENLIRDWEAVYSGIVEIHAESLLIIKDLDKTEAFATEHVLKKYNTIQQKLRDYTYKYLTLKNNPIMVRNSKLLFMCLFCYPKYMLNRTIEAQDTTRFNSYLTNLNTDFGFFLHNDVLLASCAGWKPEKKENSLPFSKIVMDLNGKVTISAK